MSKKIYISEEQFSRLQNIIKEDDSNNGTSNTITITPPLDGNKSINPSTPIPDGEVKKVVNNLRKNPTMMSQLKKGQLNIQPIGNMNDSSKKFLQQSLGLQQPSYSANENIVVTKKIIEESRINRIITEGESLSKKDFETFLLNNDSL